MKIFKKKKKNGGKLEFKRTKERMKRKNENFFFLKWKKKSPICRKRKN